MDDPVLRHGTVKRKYPLIEVVLSVWRLAPPFMNKLDRVVSELPLPTALWRVAENFYFGQTMEGDSSSRVAGGGVTATYMGVSYGSCRNHSAIDHRSTLSLTSLEIVVMSSEAILNLSIPDLIHVLDERLGLECAKLQGTSLPPAMGSASLEAEIASLETRAHDVLRSINSLRNLLQPVNRLPPEILSRIAQCVPAPSAQDARTIIPLTHVCRYWRASIVSFPENWTLISSQSVRLAALFLERARATPLKIWLDMDEIRGQPRFPDLIAPHVHKAIALEFSGLMTSEDLTDTLPDFPQSMPNLQWLDISLLAHAPDWNPSIDPFSSFPAALRCLFLYDIPLYSSILNLRGLTKFLLHNYKFNHSLDTLLTVLEENRSLVDVELRIDFTNPILRSSPQRAPIHNRLQRLSVKSYTLGDIKALVSSIPLKKGAHLKIDTGDSSAGLNNILSSIPTTHLTNLQLPTYVRVCGRALRLSGPNGSFSFFGLSTSEMSLSGLPLLSFNNVRELRFGYPQKRGSTVNHRALDPSPFPALEALAVEYDTGISTTLSALLSSPKSYPLLKTLAFLNCNLPRDFMEKLTQFASARKNTTSAWLYRVLIVHSSGFSDVDSVVALGGSVPVVDVRFGRELPKDLT